MTIICHSNNDTSAANDYSLYIGTYDSASSVKRYTKDYCHIKEYLSKRNIPVCE